MNSPIPVKTQTITAPTNYLANNAAIKNNTYVDTSCCTIQLPVDDDMKHNYIDETFIAVHPSGAIAIFEDRLNALRRNGYQTDSYLEKLNNLKKKLDALIIEWV